MDKLEEEKAALVKEKEGWEAERKRLASWRVRCLDSEEKLNKRIGELEEDYEDLKDKYDGAVGELDDLKNSVIQEHINGFEKGCGRRPSSIRMWMPWIQDLTLIKM